MTNLFYSSIVLGGLSGASFGHIFGDAMMLLGMVTGMFYYYFRGLQEQVLQ